MLRLCVKCPCKTTPVLARSSHTAFTTSNTGTEILSFCRFEVLTATVTKSSFCWNTVPCILLKVNRCLRGTSSLQLQGQRIRQERNQLESCSKQVLVHSSNLKMETIYSLDFDWLSTDYTSVYLTR